MTNIIVKKLLSYSAIGILCFASVTSVLKILGIDFNMEDLIFWMSLFFVTLWLEKIYIPDVTEERAEPKKIKNDSRIVPAHNLSVETVIFNQK